ncbi:MAG: alpha-glucan family phosphorylase [Candidatus Levybacteria bacterium]|nr:alpha-glucan family phosphorylase [Candidatus Levybacteria bacterium]
MQDDLNWFSSFLQTDDFKQFQTQPVAYFSAEYALSDKLPIFAGGLGVLSGDTIKEAGDRSFPLVALGLYYREGYVSQKVDETGSIVDGTVVLGPKDSGIVPVNDTFGNPIKLTVPIQDRHILVSAWKYSYKNVNVFLLDTNVEENSAEDRAITSRLYTTDKETRLKQEMVLGIGGIRLLEALRIHPSVYHLNEGHSAMLILDLMRHEMVRRQVSFQDAISLAKRHIVFTNHTLVSAGNEVFSNDLVSTMLHKYAEELQVPANEIVNLGLIQDSSRFSMTMLSLRIANRINAVSTIHQQKAKEIWADHPMEIVTNGVHIPTWDGEVGDDVLAYHTGQKQKLLSYLHVRTGVSWDEEDFVIGWARRMVPYKRPLALFQDVERFKSLATAEGRRVRVVVSGFAPPGDVDGASLMQQIVHLAKNELKDIIVYLSSYNLELARLMVAGCDIWINTPVVGFEACGTSGMKAALNGTIPVSTKDGWVDEAELFRIGWILDNDSISKSIHNALHDQILPMYFEQRDEWVAHMKNARAMSLNQFSATRMFRAYIERMYLPVLHAIEH